MTAPERPAAVPAEPVASRPGGAGPDDHVRRNRAAWNTGAMPYQARNAATLAAGGARPGACGRSPSRRLGVLDEVAGRTILELGCGGAQWSVVLARRFRSTAKRTAQLHPF
jgi:hypothetical protein